MAGQKHETVLSYKADARGLKDLARELKRTFDPGSAKDMNRAYKDMGKALKGLTVEQARLNAQLLKTKEGTEAYKTLGKALEGVEKKASQLKRTLAGIKPDPGGFTQGLAQGMFPGVAGFVQRGPGMRAQMAGQFAGAAARAPFRMAGRGGMNVGNAATGGGAAALLQGVPFLGGLASMAQGAVGAATSQEQAMLMGLMTSGGMAGVAAGRRGGIKKAAAGSAGRVERSSAEAAAAATDEIRGRWRARMIDPSTGKILNVGEDREQAIRIMAGTNNESRGLGSFLLDPAAASLRVVKEKRVAAKATQLADDAANKEVAHATKAARKRAERQEAATQAAAGRAGAASAMRSPFGGAIQAGRRMGMDDTQAIQMATQMAQQIGGGIPGGAGMDTVFGAQLQSVQTGTTGRLMRQMRAGRGGVGGDSGSIVASAIGDAVAMKLEGSEINEYLGTIASMQERAEQQGLKISAEGAGGIARAMSAMGAQGMRGAAIAGQFVTGAQRVGLQGITDPISASLYRAAGFDPAEGGLSYLRAGRKLQTLSSGGKADPGVLFDVIKNLTGGIRGTGEEARLSRERTLQKSFGQLGISLGPDEANSFAEAVRGGRAGFADALRGTEAGRTLIDGKSAATAGNLRAGARGGDLSAATALARMQAATANQLVTAGKTVAPTVAALNLNAAKLATGVGELLAPVNEFVPLMRDVTKSLRSLMAWAGEKGQSLAKETVSE